MSKNSKQNNEPKKLADYKCFVLFAHFITNCFATWAKSIVFNHYVLNAINDGMKNWKRFLAPLNIMNYMGISLYNGH